MRYTTQELRDLWRDFRCDESKMVSVAFGPTHISVAAPTTEAWDALAQVLRRHDYNVRDLDTGGYVCRKITGGSQPSLHSYGIAVDVNWQTNPYLKTPNRRLVRFSSAARQKDRALDVRHDRADTDMTKAMIDDVLEIVTRQGKGVFAWGGNFQTNKDCMHFQLDVSPEELAHGLDHDRLRRGEAEDADAEETEAEEIFGAEAEPSFEERNDSVPGLSSEVIAAARASHQKWSVPASVTLAQFILELNWGRSMPGGLSSNNPFGIKARAGEASVAAQTHEVEHGETIAITARFRKFASIADAFDAHGALLATARVYAPAMAHKDDPDAFADALTGRYATDPRYGAKLKSLMRAQDLYQYDGAAPLFRSIFFSGDPTSPQESDELSIGSKGARVKSLQQQLIDLDYPLGEVDGIFGTLTRAALVAFQVDNGLIGTGSTNSLTWKALNRGQHRPLDSQRTGANSADVAAKGSVVVNQADNVKLAGLLSSILGALGVTNSMIVNAQGHMAVTSPDTLGSTVANVTTAASNQAAQIITSLTSLAGKVGAVKNSADFQSASKTANELQTTIASLHLNAGDLAQGVEQLRQAVAGNPALVSVVNNLASSHTPQAAANGGMSTIFDILPTFFQNGSNMQLVSKHVILPVHA